MRWTRNFISPFEADSEMSASPKPLPTGNPTPSTHRTATHCAPPGNPRHAHFCQVCQRKFTVLPEPVSHGHGSCHPGLCSPPAAAQPRGAQPPPRMPGRTPLGPPPRVVRLAADGRAAGAGGPAVPAGPRGGWGGAAGVLPACLLLARCGCPTAPRVGSCGRGVWGALERRSGDGECGSGVFLTIFFLRSPDRCFLTILVVHFFFQHTCSASMITTIPPTINSVAIFERRSLQALEF